MACAIGARRGLAGSRPRGGTGQAGSQDKVHATVDAVATTRRLSCAMFADLVGYSISSRTTRRARLAAVEQLRQVVVKSHEPASAMPGASSRRHGGRFLCRMRQRLQCGPLWHRHPARHGGAHRPTSPRLPHGHEPGRDDRNRQRDTMRHKHQCRGTTGDAVAAAGHLPVAVRLDAVAGRIDAQFEQGGIHNLRDMRRPVRVWHWEPRTALVRARPPARGA